MAPAPAPTAAVASLTVNVVQLFAEKLYPRQQPALFPQLIRAVAAPSAAATRDTRLRIALAAIPAVLPSLPALHGMDGRSACAGPHSLHPRATAMRSSRSCSTR